MAVVVLFRVAIAVAPLVARFCQSSGCDANTAANAIARFWDRLRDPGEDPDELATEMTASIGGPEGGVIYVTDVAAPFETRKLVVRFGRTPASLVAEDVDVIGVQFLKTSGGVPTNAWVDGDYTTLETAFSALWTNLKGAHVPTTILQQYRWYADGPAFHPAPALGNPARRVTDLSVAGSMASGTSMLPPQSAESVTFKTSSRKHWGRIYWPAVEVGRSTNEGVILSAYVDVLASSWVTFLNAARAANLRPVVFSKTAGTAFEITTVQVDNLFDVIRRRRWKRAGYKKETALT